MRMRKRTSSLSSSKQLLLPPSRGGNDCSSCRELVVVPPPTTSTAALTTRSRSRFRLPKGWRVDEVPRANASHIDRYYYEPGTGRKFRSLVAVQRYIKGEEEYSPISRVVVSRKTSRYRKIIITNGKMLRLCEEVLDENQLAILASSRHAKASPYNLPDGWVVEEVPRRDNSIDKYYYEPGTGRKFRSHVAVQRYLAEMNDDKPLSITFQVVRDDAPLAKMFKNSAPSKKEVSRESTHNSSFLSPPKRISWVVSSPQGDAWNPFIGKTLVPDSVRKQWSERFILVMNDASDNQGLRGLKM